MTSIIDHLNAWGGHFVSFAWLMLWQSSLLIALVLAADVLLARRVRASVRHGLWLVVLVKLLLPPTLALPTSAAWWLFPAKPTVVAAPLLPVAKPSGTEVSVVVLDDSLPPPDMADETVPVAPPPRPKLNSTGWMLLAAGTISAGLICWLLARWWQLGQRVRGAATIDGRVAAENLEDTLEQTRRRSGLRAKVRLRLVEGNMSPAVCGLFRPVILLPRLLVEKLSPAQLQAVLLHEMIHLRRCDIWVNCAQSLLQIFYWWHPLLWVANARIRRVREEAVDDAVMLALAGDAETYAPTLLEVAKLAFRRPLLSLGLVGIMESRSALRQRIERLVDFRAPRKAGLTLVSVCGIFVFSAVAVPMGQGPAAAAEEDGKSRMEDGRSGTAEASAGNTPATGNGPLTDTNFQTALRALEERTGRNNLGEPEMTGEPRNLVNRIDTPAYLDVPIAQSSVSDSASSTVLVSNTLTNISATRLARLNADSSLDTNFSIANGILLAQAEPGTIAVSTVPPSHAIAESPNTQEVLIQAQIFRMMAADFQNLVSGLQSGADKTGSNTWWLSTPEEFVPLGERLKQLGLKPLSRPRIITTSGHQAVMYVGDPTNGLSLDCTPVVAGDEVNMAVHCEITEPSLDTIITNRCQVDTILRNHGGIAVMLQNSDQSHMSNLVAFIGVQIITNGPESHFQTRLTRITKPVRQVHIKARFIAVQGSQPMSFNSQYMSFNWTNAGNPQVTGILTSQNLKAMLQALTSQAGNEDLGEPEITTLSGRQSQMRATVEMSVLTNMDVIDDGSGHSITTPQTMTVETGPILDVVPRVSDDGYSINLKLVPSLTEFFGYDLPEQPPGTNEGRITPKFETQQLSVDLNLWDNQTVLLSGFKDHSDTLETDKVPVVGDVPLLGRMFQHTKNVPARNVLVLITATVVDAAGNRVHSESEMQQMQEEIPPQPTNTTANPFGGVQITTNLPATHFQQRLQRISGPAGTNDGANLGGTTKVMARSVPQVHIKARFIAVPHGTKLDMGQFLNPTNAGSAQLTGILTSKNMSSALQTLASQPDVETLAEPEATLLSGRQVQMRATEVMTVVTNVSSAPLSLTPAPGTPITSALRPQTTTVETGPVLDVVPQVSDDGYAIHLNLSPSLTEFLGYEKQEPGKTTNGIGVTPKFETQQLTTELNLWDGQTVLLGGFKDHVTQTSKDKVLISRDIPLIGRLFQSEHGTNVLERNVLILITANIVDAAGNLVHSESEMQRMQDTPPPQPTGTDANPGGGVQVITTNTPPMYFQQRLNRISKPAGTNDGANALESPGQSAIADSSPSSRQMTKTFVFKGPKSENEARQVLLDAGVEMPPTTFLYTDNGLLVARGTPDQLALVYQVALKLNGFPPQNNAAGHESFAQELALKAVDDSTNLVERTFRLNTNQFLAYFETHGGSETNPTTPFRNLFNQLGLDFGHGTGKSVFYNAHLGYLFVTATASDVEAVEAVVMAIQQTNPPSMHVEQRLQRISKPPGTNDAVNFIQSLGPDLSAKTTDEPTNLPARTFMLDTNQFLAYVKTHGGSETDIITPLKNLFSPMGLDFGPNTGKSIFYKDRLGWLYVKATASDLDKVDAVLAANYLTTGLLTDRSRAKVFQKLNEIHVSSVTFENSRLSQVLSKLAVLSRTGDPQKAGVNFLINNSLSTNFDVGYVTINVPTTNGRLADILDAIVKSADDPIQYSVHDFAVIFSAKSASEVPTGSASGHTPEQLFMRSFKMYTDFWHTNYFAVKLQSQGIISSLDDATNSHLISAGLRNLFTQAGVDLTSPPGKSVYYDPQPGLIFVKATEADLNKVEKALQQFVPRGQQVDIKARIFSVPGTNMFGDWHLSPEGGFTRMLTESNALVALQAVKSRKGVIALGEPEVTTRSGSRAELFVGEELTLFTNLIPVQNKTNSAIDFEPQTDQLETGPRLNLAPRIEYDGYTIHLPVKAMLTEFFGYADVPKKLGLIWVTNSTGTKLGGIGRIWPAVDKLSETTVANLYDGQTLVMALCPAQAEQIQFSDPDPGREAIVAKHIAAARKKQHDPTTLVFITANIIDPTGVKVHPGGELPFAPDEIPAQPTETNDESVDFPVHPIHASPPAANTNSASGNESAELTESNASVALRLRVAQSRKDLVTSVASGIVQDAKLLYEEGKLNEAETKLSQALTLDPDNKTASYYLDLVKQAEAGHDPTRPVATQNSLPVPNPYATNRLIFTGPGRQQIVARLDKIHLDTVSWDGVPLSSVLEQLGAQCRLRDPEHKGINFLINNNPDLSGETVLSANSAAPTIDPKIGLPVAPDLGTETPDVGTYIIKIPSLSDVRMADVLDAIVLVSDHPLKYSVQDFAIVFSAKNPEEPQLFMRTFRIDPNTFYSGLANAGTRTFGAYQNSGNGNGGNQQNNGTVVGAVNPFTGGGNQQDANAKTPQSAPVQHAGSSPSAAARAYITALGINLLKPPGKVVFYNDRLGLLFVKGMESDLDTIQRALQILNETQTPPLLNQTHPPPQIHVKAEFFEAPKGTLGEFNLYWNLDNGDAARAEGILTSKAAIALTQALQSRNEIKLLGAPEVTTASARLVQMRVDSAGSPQTGPVLDIAPYVLADGYTIKLSTATSIQDSKGHIQLLGRPGPLPGTAETETANIWDNQTLFSGVSEHIDETPAGAASGSGTQAPALQDKELLILVTATIVDPAGNRVHSDEELPFAQKGFPTQPAMNGNGLRGMFDYPDTSPNSLPRFILPSGGGATP